MAELFEVIRERATKAAFEADKLKRITQIRASMISLNRELEQEKKRLGDAVFQLYDTGKLTQPELLELCEQLAPMRGQIAEKEAEIERIRQEEPPEVPIPALYGHICQRCRTKFPGEVVFCPRCGTRIEDVPPPTGLICPKCGAALAEGTVFCPSCGVRVVEEASESLSTQT
ncbi:MAG: zinc-ribbon domain-containing protein [Anaerolineales bacterium]|nr:zinc-ribbon domain-containing protein [Anaerolineales bacterium]